MRCADKNFDLKTQLRKLTKRRLRPRIKTHAVVGGALVMEPARKGSLIALEQTESNCFWKNRITGGILPSADTIGRVHGLLDVDKLRSDIEALDIFSDL